MSSSPPPLPPDPGSGAGDAGPSAGPAPTPQDGAAPTSPDGPAHLTNPARGGGDPFTAEDVQWQAVSPALARARRIGAGVLVLPALPIAALAVALDRPLLFAALAVPVLGYAWAWWLIGRQVRAWGYAERPEELLLRSGVMWRRIVVVPYGRLQYVDVEAGPLARALGIATVQLHTASAGSDAQMPGLPVEEAARLRDALTERGQAQLAGL